VANSDQTEQKDANLFSNLLVPGFSCSVLVVSQPPEKYKRTGKYYFKIILHKACSYV
jgi:hypothetical protein